MFLKVILIGAVYMNLRYDCMLTSKTQETFKKETNHFCNIDKGTALHNAIACSKIWYVETFWYIIMDICSDIEGRLLILITW